MLKQGYGNVPMNNLLANQFNKTDNLVSDCAYSGSKLHYLQSEK